MKCRFLNFNLSFLYRWTSCLFKLSQRGSSSRIYRNLLSGVGTFVFFKKIYYVLGTISFLLLLGASLLTFDNYLVYIFVFIRILLLLLLLFSIFMSVIWNRMEVHGILAGKLTMEIELQRISSTGQSCYAQTNHRKYSSGGILLESSPGLYQVS